MSRLPELQTDMFFDGVTYDPTHDQKRLSGQCLAVYNLMFTGDWHTLAYISREVGASEASVSARLRDLRKERFGSHTVNRMRLKGGLYVYRLETKGGGQNQQN